MVEEEYFVAGHPQRVTRAYALEGLNAIATALKKDPSWRSLNDLSSGYEMQLLQIPKRAAGHDDYSKLGSRRDLQALIVDSARVQQFVQKLDVATQVLGAVRRSEMDGIHAITLAPPGPCVIVANEHGRKLITENCPGTLEELTSQRAIASR